MRGAAMMATTTGLKGKRPGPGTYVLVKVSR